MGLTFHKKGSSAQSIFKVTVTHPSWKSIGTVAPVKTALVRAFKTSTCQIAEQKRRELIGINNTSGPTLLENTYVHIDWPLDIVHVVDVNSEGLADRDLRGCT